MKNIILLFISDKTLRGGYNNLPFGGVSNNINESEVDNI